jgi:hypothetical protein
VTPATATAVTRRIPASASENRPTGPRLPRPKIFIWFAIPPSGRMEVADGRVRPGGASTLEVVPDRCGG